MGDLPESFPVCVRVRTKHAEKTRVGLWGQSTILKAVWDVTPDAFSFSPAGRCLFLGEVVWRRCPCLFCWFEGYSMWLLLWNALGMLAAFLGDFQPCCLTLVSADPWCCLVGRSLLIRDRELVLWLKLVFGLCVVLFRWFGGREVCDSCIILRLSALRNVAQLGCWGLEVLFGGCSLWGCFLGGYGVPSLCGTIFILFKVKRNNSLKEFNDE
ncbi:transmembrane protein, putative [Medicago truncatula]|uniref:Transmembrane protein, putative n=1 Tax=Medicago truncatula TaxID=3880 RepID=A0A072VQ96_MEDTR|nr:transmembrane protein, putative [Medicago truncatula]